MKYELPPFSINRLAKEFSTLQNGFINKIYQPSPEEFQFKINTQTEGKLSLYIKLGKWITLTKKRIENPIQPHSFVMFLRKRIRNARIIEIRQHQFDRVIELHLQKGEKKFFIIIELFAKGNILLVDEDYKILMPLRVERWKHRTLAPKKDYLYPPGQTNPFVLEQEEFNKIFSETNLDIIRTLALNINLGGKIAEEICLRCMIEKNRMASSLSLDEREKLFFEMKKILEEFEKEKAAFLYYKSKDKDENIKKETFTPLPDTNERDTNKYKNRLQSLFSYQNIVDLVPIKLEIYKNYPYKSFESFNDAVDEFFFEETPIEEIKEKKEIKREKTSLLTRKEKQEEMMEKLKHEIKDFKRKGDLIWENYDISKQILDALELAKEKFEWREIIKKTRGNKLIERIEPENGVIILKVDDDGKETDIALDFRLNPQSNADNYYQKGKKAKLRLEGAKKALEQTIELIKKESEKRIEGSEEIEEEERIPQITRKKRFWFEKYRWFFTSSGNIVVSGKDAKSNDLVVKKYLKERDRYAHADIHGASSVVIKSIEDERVSEDSLKEGCSFAAINSKYWGRGLAKATVFWVNPEQVSKTPESGEFLAKGAFVIRGKKNFMKDIVLEAGVGIIEYEGEKLLMCAPSSIIKKRCESYIIFKVGELKRKDFIDKIFRKFRVSKEEIERIIPGGGVGIVETD